MAIDPRAMVELERRGVASVREQLRTATGYGQGSTVDLDLPSVVPKPNRGEVEEWLRAKDAAVEQLSAHRHGWLLTITIIGTVAAVVAAVASVWALLWPPKP